MSMNRTIVESNMNALANFDKIKYQFDKNNIVPGFYTIHRPSQCNLKFPKDNRPIHKKTKNAYVGKETITVLQNGKWRHILIPKNEKIVYPTVIHEKQYEVLKKHCSREKSAQNNQSKLNDLLENGQELKKQFKAKQKPQPGSNDEKSTIQSEPDIKVHTKLRAVGLHNEEFQGARIANQIILASKCHAIRDAQLTEKALIKKQLEEENKRMDAIMEQARVAALEKEQKQYNDRKARRLEHIDMIKEQISMNKLAKAQELEIIDKEYARLTSTDAAILKDDVERHRKKREDASRRMAYLDKCNQELLECKRKQIEEDRVMEERIKKFIQYRRERETKLKLTENAKKNARENGILQIVKAQETTKKHKEEIELVRISKIQEDVEREYREKEKALAIKKSIELKKLKEGRDKQIADVRRQIAAEMSREEEIYKNIIQKNEQEALKEKEKLKLRQEALKNHRQWIIKQINEKERKRIDLKEREVEEGLAMKFEIERLDNLEKSVVKQKVDEMREQKIPDIYVNEVEHRLAKLCYY